MLLKGAYEKRDHGMCMTPLLYQLSIFEIIAKNRKLTVTCQKNTDSYML